MAKIHNIDVEQQIIGLILREASTLVQCNLKPNDFSQQTNQHIFEAIQQVSNKGLAVDMLTVGENLERQHGHVDMRYLGELFENSTGAGVNMAHYCGIIRQSARLRKAREIALTIQYAIDNTDECDNLIEKSISSLMSIDTQEKNYSHTLSEAVQAALGVYDEAQHRGGLIGISTGFTELDSTLGGFHDSDLFVIGARPAVGKTALLFNFAHACDDPAGIISAEQNHAQAGIRFIAMDGEINSHKFRTGKLSPEDFQKLGPTVKNLDSKNIYINDEPGIDITSLMRQARVWKQSFGIKILFVDYIQKIKGTSNRQSPNERVAEVASSLKDLARELDIPVVALSQVNREADRLDGPPGAAHLSDSSAIEKEADGIMTIFRNEEYKRNGQALLHICKNRHGPTGDTVVNYYGKFFKFTDQGMRYAR